MRAKFAGRRVVLVAATLLLAGAACAGIGRPAASEAAHPDYVPGEILVLMEPGHSVESAATAAQATSWKQPLPRLSNAYTLRVSTNADVVARSAQLRSMPEVRTAQPNYRLRGASLRRGALRTRNLAATPQPRSLPPNLLPNDPLFNQQWFLPVMGSEDAWSITLGQRGDEGPKPTIVALLDTGVSLTHPDLQDVLLPGWDFVDDDPFPTDVDGHGTWVAGAIATGVNNGIGGASLAWEAVKILPLRIVDPATRTASTLDAVLAMFFALDQGAEVITLSLAGDPGLSLPFLHAGIIAVVEEGVPVISPVGNPGPDDFGDPANPPPDLGVNTPALFDEVIAVAAVGPERMHAWYSYTGSQVEISAPGGDNFGGRPEREVIGLRWSAAQGNHYAGAQGTGFAAGLASGALGVLISEGAIDSSIQGAARVAAIRQLIRTTAHNPSGTHSTTTGWGTLNLGAALRKSVTHFQIETPAAGFVSPNLAEPVIGRVVIPPGQFGPRPLNPANLQFFLNGEDVSANLQIHDLGQGTFSFQPDIDTHWLPGLQEIDLRIFDPDTGRTRRFKGDAVNNIPARAFTFRVSQRFEAPGLRQFSIPYGILAGAEDPSFLFGNQAVVLFRWLQHEFRYARFQTFGQPREPEASFMPPSAGVVSPPAGLGYWARFDAGAPLNLLGVPDRTPFYRIPARAGWSMIATPYPFDVAWNSLMVDVNGTLHPLGQAIQLGFLRSALVEWDGNRYQFRFFPQGELRVWRAYWVHCNVDLDFIVTRTPLNQPLDRGIDPVDPPPTGGTGGGRALPPVGGRDTIFRSLMGAGPLQTTHTLGDPNFGPVGGWRLPITARVNGRVTGEVVIGTATNASNGPGPEDITAPPPPELVADVRSLRTEWGRQNGTYLQDLWQDGTRTARWVLELTTAEPNTTVTLTWGEVPPNALIQIRPDGRPGQLLRSNGSLTLSPRQAGTTHLHIVAVRR